MFFNVNILEFNKYQLTFNYSLCSIQDSVDNTCVKYIAKFHVISLLHAYINSGALPNKKNY